MTSTSGGYFLPDRVDLPFSTEPDITGTVEIGTLLVPRPAFPDRNWTADWRAWHVLADFLAIPNTPSGAPGWTDGINLPGPPTNPGLMAQELTDLVTAAQTERLEALGEITAQSDGFLDYFSGLLTTTPATYPATWRMMNAAVLIGLYAVMQYKLQYNRARPSHLVPALLPPIPVPGHASYPSGHSTQAHLVALCLLDTVPVPAATKPDVMESNLTALANRIARNRELAGLHFKSDSDAGVELAKGLFNNFKNHMPLTEPDDNGVAKKWSKYQVIAAAITKEWQ